DEHLVFVSWYPHHYKPSNPAPKNGQASADLRARAPLLVHLCPCVSVWNLQPPQRPRPHHGGVGTARGWHLCNKNLTKQRLSIVEVAAKRMMCDPYSEVKFCAAFPHPVRASPR